MLRSTLILLLMVFTHSVLLGQVKKVAMDHHSYSMQNGFIDNVLGDIYIDSLGFLYFSTSLGYFKTDGQHIYNTEMEDEGITSLAFHKSAEGDLLMTGGNGIHQMDFEHNRFKKKADFEQNIESAEFIMDDVNHYYLITNENSILKYRKTDLILEKEMNFDFSIITQSHLYSYSCDLDYLLLYDHSLGSIYIIDSEELSIKGKIDFEGLVMYIHVDQEGIWVLTDSEIILLDKTSFIVRKKKRYPTRSGTNLRCSILPYDLSHFLISINKKIFLFNKNSFEWIEEWTSRSGENFAKIGSIKKMEKDPFGNVYVNTLSEGLVKIKPGNSSFSKLVNNDLEDYFSKCIWVDSKREKILVGTFNKGILVFDLEYNFLFQIQSVNGKRIDSPVTAIVQCGDGKYWVEVMTFDANYILDIPDNTSYQMVALEDPHLESKTYYTSYQVIDDSTTLVNRRKAQIVMNNASEDFYQLLFYDEEIQRDNFSVSAFQRDNFIYLGSKNEVRILNLVEARYENPIKMDNVGLIKCILDDGPNGILFGTDRGVYRYDLTKKTYEHVFGFFDMVYTSVKDNNEEYWFGTNYGLVHVDKFGRLKRYLEEDGIPDNEFNTNSSTITKEGEIIMGTIKGAFAFDPTEMSDEQQNSDSYLAEVSVNGTPVSIKSIFDSGLNLKSTENTISIKMVGIGKLEPQDYNYQYRMSGSQKNWVNGGRNSSVTYNLSPGKYNFDFLASLTFQPNSNDYKQFEITVNQPFWKRWYFISGISLFTVALISYLIAENSQKKLRRKQYEWSLQEEIQNKKDQLSRELHDNIGAQVATIRRNLDWMISYYNKSSDAQRLKRLESMSTISNNISSDLRDTIWASSKSSISTEEFSDRLKSYLLQLRVSNPSFNIKLEEQIVENLILRPEEALHLFRIAQEALQNSIKHGKASQITVNIETNDTKSFKMSLADNGIGFNNENTDDFGNGLSNIKYRANQINYQLDIKSELGAGTSIMLNNK